MFYVLALLTLQTAPDLSEIEKREVRCVQAAMIAAHQLQLDGEADAPALVMPIIAFNKGRLLARRPGVDWHVIIGNRPPEDLVQDSVLALRVTRECQDELNEIVWPRG